MTTIKHMKWVTDKMIVPKVHSRIVQYMGISKGPLHLRTLNPRDRGMPEGKLEQLIGVTVQANTLQPISKLQTTDFPSPFAPPPHPPALPQPLE